RSSSDQPLSARPDSGGFGDTNGHEPRCGLPTVRARRNVRHAQTMRTTKLAGLVAFPTSVRVAARVALSDRLANNTRMGHARGSRHRSGKPSVSLVSSPLG